MQRESLCWQVHRRVCDVFPQGLSALPPAGKGMRLNPLCEGARCLCHGGPEKCQYGHLQARCAWFRSQLRSHLPRLHVVLCDSQCSTTCCIFYRSMRVCGAAASLAGQSVLQPDSNSSCSCQAPVAGVQHAAPSVTHVAACSTFWHQAMLLPGYQSRAIGMQHPVTILAANLTLQKQTLLLPAFVRHTVACWTDRPDAVAPLAQGCRGRVNDSC